jgi:3',5'-cyclic AMP phosphodiesterase CpdA
MFVLAHLSDPHLGPLPRPHPSELASKRLLGYLNWRRSRHRIHRTEVLDAITRDIHAARPDHIAVTGDLVNIGLPAEFALARRWLDALGKPADVSLVPGNHDAYVAAAALHGERHWAPYMTGDVPGAETFPYLRRRGPVALVGLSTAIATPPFMATGKLGEAQIARAAKLLGDLRTANAFRVVMIHHPPVAPPSAHHKRLIDAAAFRKAIAAIGAELIIHGHDHVHALGWLARDDGGRIPVVGVPSASACAGMKHHAAAYNLYEIDGRPGAWSCEVVSRGLRTSGTVDEINRFALSWSAHA